MGSDLKLARLNLKRIGRLTILATALLTSLVGCVRGLESVSPSGPSGNATTGSLLSDQVCLDPTSGACPAELSPLVEFVFAGSYDDVIYDTLSAKNKNYFEVNFKATQALGLAFKIGKTGPQLRTLYRCLGQRSSSNSWQFSFYSTNPSCDDAPTVPGAQISSTPTAVIYSADLPAEQQSGKVAIYRYWAKTPKQSTPVLSTVAPKLELLTVMRYELDPQLGTRPLGYLNALNANLDGNQRWIKGLEQNFCFGITQFQPNCPAVKGNLSWQLYDLRSGDLVYSYQSANTATLRLSAALITDLIAQGAVKANAPLLLTVSANGRILGALNSRILRTPFYAQYEGIVAADDDGEPSSFPTSASAALLANQMTAHTLLQADPLSGRTLDPALFDVVSPNVFANPYATYSSLPPDKVAAKQRAAFQKLDAQGLLISAEIGNLTGLNIGQSTDIVYPVDDAQFANTAQDPALASYQAESFNPVSGQFFKRSPTTGGFVPDYASGQVLQWLKDGTQSFIQRMAQNGVSLAFFGPSEQNLDNNIYFISSGNNDIPYYSSPTYSAAAHADFLNFLAQSGASGYTGFPMLAAEYQRAVDKQNPNINRLQLVSPQDPLWQLWSQWRRNLLARALTQVTLAAKEAQKRQDYFRSPLQTFIYNYVGWTTINNRHFDIDTNSFVAADIYRSSPSLLFDPNALLQFPTEFQDLGNYTNQNYVFGTNKISSSTWWINAGTDFSAIAAQSSASPKAVAIDYYVSEIKGLSPTDSQLVAAELQQIKQQFPVAKTGLHVELEWSTSVSNDVDTFMDEIFAPSQGGYRSPAFDAVWSWEAQCEYVLTMKGADPGANENLAARIGPKGIEITLGSYASIYNDYQKVIGDFCLFRHVNSNLQKVCTPGQDCKDTVSHSQLQSHWQNFINRRQAYLLAQ